MKKVAVHCFLSSSKHTRYWLEHLEGESISHAYLHNVKEDFADKLQNVKKATVLSSYEEQSDEKKRIFALNQSIERARKDGNNWLLCMRDTDILDVRTTVSFPQVMNNLEKNKLSMALIKVYEMVKTIDKEEYNYFINEEYAYTNPKSNVDPKNILLNETVKHASPEQGQRIICNLNCKSLMAVSEKRTMIRDSKEAKIFSSIFNVEPRAWRILSYSMCEYEEWKNVSDMASESDEDNKFLYETTVLVSEDSVKDMHSKGEVFIIDEAQMMNVTLSNNNPKNPAQQPAPQKNISKAPSSASIPLEVGNVDQAIVLVKTILSALEHARSHS